MPRPSLPVPDDFTKYASIEGNLEAQRQTIEACAKAVEKLSREVPYDNNQAPCSLTKSKAARAIRALRPNLALATPPASNDAPHSVCKRHKLLAFVVAYQRSADGHSPSMQQIADHLECCKSEVYRLVIALEVDGKIRRIRNKVRSLQVVDASLPQTQWHPIAYAPRDQWVLITAAAYPLSTRRALWWQSRQRWAVHVTAAGDPIFDDHMEPTHFAALPHLALLQPDRDTDRNPEGGDAQRLRAEHESGGPEGIARTSSDRNAGEI